MKRDREENESVINPSRSSKPVPRREVFTPRSLGEVLRSQREERAEAEEEEVVQLLTFMVGTEEYGLNIMDIKEIIRPKEATEIPRAPSYVLGIISLRGVIIPIYDMRRRLGLRGAELTRYARIVVVKQKENLFGLLVDSVVQVMNISVGSIEPPPDIIGGVDAEFLMGVGKIDDRLIILLNLEKVLAIEEGSARRLEAEEAPPALPREAD